MVYTSQNGKSGIVHPIALPKSNWKVCSIGCTTSKNTSFSSREERNRLMWLVSFGNGSIPIWVAESSTKRLGIEIESTMVARTIWLPVSGFKALILARKNKIGKQNWQNQLDMHQESLKNWMAQLLIILSKICGATKQTLFPKTGMRSSLSPRCWELHVCI